MLKSAYSPSIKPNNQASPGWLSSISDCKTNVVHLFSRVLLRLCLLVWQPSSSPDSQQLLCSRFMSESSSTLPKSSESDWETSGSFVAGLARKRYPQAEIFSNNVISLDSVELTKHSNSCIVWASFNSVIYKKLNKHYSTTDWIYIWWKHHST